MRVQDVELMLKGSRCTDAAAREKAMTTSTGVRNTVPLGPKVST